MKNAEKIEIKINGNWEFESISEKKNWEALMACVENEKSILKVLLISVCLEVTRMWYILYDEDVL